MLELNHPPDYIAPGSPNPQEARADLPPLDASNVDSSKHPDIEFQGREQATETGSLPTVSVVVLNYNGLKHLETCFASLSALDYPKDRLELMLVDNGSHDASLNFMRERFPAVRLVETGENLGFAQGNNFGAERATGEYVAFLNNDTRVESNWLLELMRGVQRGESSGVVCAASLMLNWAGENIDFLSGALNFHGFGFQPSYGLPAEATLQRYFPQPNSAPIDSESKIQNPKLPELLFACGGSMLIRRDVFLQVGGFDPNYFAFFEDVDLGWRLWILGHRVVLVPTAITYHRHHGTAGSLPHHRVQVLYERNALYTIYKNYEAANLERILPAALLLLGQRVVRFMELGGVDFSSYDFSQPMGPAQSGAQDTDNVHRNALANLLAVDEFRANLDRVGAKRSWIQDNRRRSDQELFTLFGQPGRVHLLNHESDAPYAAAHLTLLHEFGIEQLWEDQPKEVLVISPDVLPVGEIPASGSGIRAWALGKGLESRGHRVRFTMPAAALSGREKQVPIEYVRGAWTPETLQAIVDGLAPDVVVSCGWPNLTWLPRANLPVALDLTGPHLLERIYQEYRDVVTNSEEKLEALRRADFFTCIGERQRYYFTAWLSQAGVNPDDIAEALRVIPYSLNPEQPTHHWPDNWQGEPVRFVYGGIFLPWQNPAPALLTVASTLQEQGGGQLEVIGGKHPFHSVHTGGFGPLVDKLATMPGVKMSGLLPHDELVNRYTRAHVAVDLMMPNAERELAFPSRTVHYMWCGLPVIHAAFSEIAASIREYEAGWIVPHDDEVALHDVVISVLANPAEARRRGENAARLAKERFSWAVTIDSLDSFVRNPYLRQERMRRKRTVDRPDIAAERSRYVAATPLIARDVDDAQGLPHGISTKLQSMHTRRRSIGAQVRARTQELVRSIGAGVGGALGGQLALPELIVGHSLAQRFYVRENGLSGVRVEVATFGRRNTSRLFLRLRDNPGAASDIYQVEIPTHGLRDGQTLALRFPPIANSASRWLYFVAESPDGVTGDAITLKATATTIGMPAQRYEDGVPAGGSLVMSLEYTGVTDGR